VKNILLIFLLLVLLFPAAQVLSLRWINPPVTGTSIQRWLEAKSEGGALPPLRIRWTPQDQIPATFFQFVWTSEDQRFFDHQGFDWIEMRKAWEERKAGAGRGASTITMQCARTVFLWQGRSWFRKTLEAYYTFWMELLLGKERILELYVNVVEMGAGVYGVGFAADELFGKSPVTLTREEQAMLVALLPNPREWNPNNPSKVLTERQRRILRRAGAARFPDALRHMGVD